MTETLTIRESMLKARSGAKGLAAGRITLKLQALEQAERQILRRARCGLPGCRFGRSNISLARWILVRDEHRASEHPTYKAPKWRNTSFKRAA